MQLKAIFAIPEKPSAFIGCSTGELECVIPKNALQITRYRNSSDRIRTPSVDILGRRFTGGGEQFCPRLVGRFDKSGHFEC